MLPFDALRPSETPSGLLDSALRVAGLPLRIHPLIEKRPLLKDWPARATNDAGQIERWLEGGRSYGIVCDEVAVIDTDSRDLALWWYRNMPETPWMVRTPSGGGHFFYRSVPGLKNATKAHRGWDVRAGGRGSIVGFGSEVGGKRYELIGEATLGLPPFDPEWLPPEHEKTVIEPPMIRNSIMNESRAIKNIRGYISRILSIQGQRGSDACFRVACVLRDEGYTPDEALSLMLEWNERCAVPGWSAKELIHKIQDSFSKTLKGGLR